MNRMERDLKRKHTLHTLKHEEAKVEMGVGSSLWLILWVWKSRVPNTGWPGFSNEFDSSLCLLSLAGD